MASAPDPRRLNAQKKAEAARNLRWVIDLGDEQVTFRMADLTALDVAALRKATGMAVGEAILLASAGDRASWLQVAESLTLDNEIVIRMEDEPEPEVSASDPPG